MLQNQNTMPIVTMSFARSDAPVDWTQANIFGLQESILIVLDRHFSGYEQAAGAQREHGRVKAELESEANLHLFGSVEALRGGLSAHPMALAWSSFEQEAAARVAPYCVSIKFTG